MRIQMNEKVLLKPNYDIPVHYKLKKGKEAYYTVCPNCATELYWYWEHFHHDYASKACDSMNESESSRYWKIVDECRRVANHEIIGNILDNVGISIINEKEGYNWNTSGEILCPICGSYLCQHNDHNFSYYVSNVRKLRDKSFGQDYMTPDADFAFKLLKEQRLKYDKMQSRNLAKKAIDSLVFDNYKRDLDKALTIKESTELLKEYLHILLNLETNIESLTMWLSDLYSKQLENDRMLIQEKSMTKYKLKQKIDVVEKKRKKVNQEITSIQTMTISQAGKEFELPEKPIAPREPVYTKPGLFNKKKVESENAALKLKYEEECFTYAEKMEHYQSILLEKQTAYEMFKTQMITSLEDDYKKLTGEIENLNSELENISDLEKEHVSAEYQKKILIDKEIQSTINLLKEMMDCKKQLYALDVVYGKYQDVGTMAVFYEYLVTGRCDKLEGMGGAYNLYEQEKKMTTIIENLEDIKESLEDIKQNQYMIYSAIKEMHTDINELGTSIRNVMNELGNRLSNIEKNTAITAYYSKVNAYYSKLTADRTNAIGFLLALK